MREQSKASSRRYRDGAFLTRYFVGHGIDIGGKPDPLARLAGQFPRMSSCRTWDLEDGDAQAMDGVPDASFDFIHSSHCLEHLVDVDEALHHWARILKPKGYLIITVPDEDLYERGQWPSRFNADHKWSFTIHKPQSKMPKSLNILDLAQRFSDRLELERLWQIQDFFLPELPATVDQTVIPNVECAIEIIWRKRS
jgi:predicted SAM-dependent methyltransferase